MSGRTVSSELATLVGGLLVCGSVVLLLGLSSALGGIGPILVGVALAVSSRWLPQRPVALRGFVHAAAAVAVTLGCWMLVVA